MSDVVPAHHERLLPGIGGWSAALGGGVLVGLMAWPVGHVIGVVAAVVAALAGMAALAVTSPVVEVADGHLRAGRARIPLALLAEPVPLDVAATRRELGPDLDARAYVCLRSWARTAVHVAVVDPQDPTPYWLVSTRRPAALAAAIAAGTAPGTTKAATSAR